MAGLHTNRGRKRAREARAAFGLDPEEPVGCLLTVIEEQARLPVMIAGGLPDEVAGACYSDDHGTALWVNGTHVAARQRFTLAHELGHQRCGHRDTPVDTFTTMSGKTTNPREIEANAFAAEFLVPRVASERLIPREPTLEDVVRIACGFGVSPIVVVYRVNELRLGASRRVELLRAEVQDGLAEEVVRHHGLEPVDDRIARIGGHLPYLSDSSALGAALRGSAAVDDTTARAIDRLL